MSKMSPKNKEEAYAYQFEDIIKLMKSLALVSRGAFKDELKVLKTMIASYEQEIKP